MGKKSKNKNKKKKVNPKRERYAKFRKEKPSVLNLNFPDLTTEQQKQKLADEGKINSYLKYSKNRPAKEIVERKMKSKR